MSAERIRGIKFHLDHETDESLRGIYSNLLEEHRQLVGDIETVTGHLVMRGLMPMEVAVEPIDDGQGQLELGEAI